jgi:uncharacterized membrane protein
MTDLQVLLYPFALGLFVGGAVVAVAVVETSKRTDTAVHRCAAEAAEISTRDSATCAAAVIEAVSLRNEVLVLRKKGCE